MGESVFSRRRSMFYFGQLPFYQLLLSPLLLISLSRIEESDTFRATQLSKMTRERFWRMGWRTKFLGVRKMETRACTRPPLLPTSTQWQLPVPASPPSPHTLKMSPVPWQCLPRLRHMLPSASWKRRKEGRKREGILTREGWLVRFEFCIKHQCVDSTYISPLLLPRPHVFTPAISPLLDI